MPSRGERQSLRSAAFCGIAYEAKSSILREVGHEALITHVNPTELEFPMAERRELEFNNLDEVVADAERLASGEVRTTGNHTFGQILEHLARTHDMTTGKLVAPQPPFYMKIMVALMKPMLINDKPIKPGFKLPKKAEAFFWPDQEFDVQQALTHLKESVENYKTQGPLPKHPMFGKLSREQNDQMNCRHAALHLSFVHSAS